MPSARPAVMEGITALEQAMDELAIALEIDPLDLRRRNFTDRDQSADLPYTSNALRYCYDRVAELAGWSDRNRLHSPTDDGLLRGMGCATQIWWGGGGPPSHATCRIGGDGVAQVTIGVQDIGTGSLTTARMVAAEELGLPLDRVLVVGGDTGPNIYGPVAGGSQTTPSVMPAVRGAAADVKHKLLALAGDVFEASVDDLELKDGRFRTKDGALDEPYTEVTMKLGQASIDGSGMRGPNPDGFRANTFGCQIAQVAVDPGTGEVFVDGIWAVHDIGRVINPLGASSQVEGGILQGMAYALSEERVFDRTTGVPVNATLDDYKVPTMMDTPPITVEFAPVPDVQLNTVGAKGLGEPPIIPTAAAIANAFRHATGMPPSGASPDARPSSGGCSHDDHLRAARQPRGGPAPAGAARCAAARRRHRPRRPARPGPDLGRDHRRPAGARPRGLHRHRHGRPRRRHDHARRRRRQRRAGAVDGGARGRLGRRVPDPPQPGHRRRQPLPAHALLVLPRPRVELLAGRRRHLLRADRRAPQAQPAAGRLHLGAPVRPRAGAAGVPRDGAPAVGLRRARAASWPTCTGGRPSRTGR